MLLTCFRRLLPLMLSLGVFLGAAACPPRAILRMLRRAITGLTANTAERPESSRNGVRPPRTEHGLQPQVTRQLRRPAPTGEPQPRHRSKLITGGSLKTGRINGGTVGTGLGIGTPGIAERTGGGSRSNPPLPQSRNLRDLPSRQRTLIGT